MINNEIRQILTAYMISKRISDGRFSPATLPKAQGVAKCGVVPWIRCKEIISCEVTENYTAEIQDIEGLNASKSNLFAFGSLDALVESNSPEMINSLTSEKLQKNLSWPEIRIIHQKGTDSFVKYNWDARLFLSNSGGSHHFCAARYIASKMGQCIYLHGRLHHYYIDKDKLSALLVGNKLYLCHGESDILYRSKWRVIPIEPTRDLNLFAVLIPIALETKLIRYVLDKAGFINLGAYLNSIAR